MSNAFDAPGNWLRGNLHLHTTASDGRLEPQEAVDGYHEQGYDFLAITDHNTVVDVDELDDRGMTLLPGVEIAEVGGELGQTVHCVGIGPSRQWERLEDDTAQASIARLSEICEACFVAHPSWSSLTFADILPIEGIIGVEVFNTTCRRGVGRGTSEVQWDALVARGKEYVGLAVDDAHCKYDDRYGGWIMLKTEDRSREAIYEALRAGNFYATMGPTIGSVEIDDLAVHVTSSPAVECFAVSPGPGKGSTNWRAGGGREETTSFEFDLKAGSDPVRICVVDAQGRKAWTNYHWSGDEQ
ncbi:MAG: CehA/McbA family metallohydrolase [Armatimonadota bacterium]